MEAAQKEATKEATNEEKIEAWLERLQTKADRKKAKRKAAKTKAASRDGTIEESSLKKIVFIRGETMEGSSPMMKAAPRDKIIVESPLTRTKAVSKGSLEIEEGGPTDHVLENKGPEEPLSRGRPQNGLAKEGVPANKRTGSPATPICELGTRATKEPIEDLNEDSFEDECHCNVDHEVVQYQDFVNLFMEINAES